MIKVLVVDDEKLIRKGLSTIISESNEDFQVVGQAENGLDALKMIKTNCPDVVITDIKMPMMDGIELIKKLDMTFPDIKKIVLSGFDEFNFVRETMKNGACDYLLKPINEAQLIELLKKIDKDILSENEKKINTLNLISKLDESLPLLKEQFIKSLIQGGEILSENSVLEKLKYFNLHIDNGPYYIMIVSMDNYRYFYDVLGAEQSKINSFIIRNISEESVSKFSSNFSYLDDLGLIIVCSIPLNNPDLIHNVADEMFNNIKKHTKLRFTISIGIPVDSLTELKKSYEGAADIIKYRFYKNDSSIIKYSEERKQFYKSRIQGLTENFENKLKSCIEVISYSQVTIIFNEFCEKLKELVADQLEVIRAFSDLYMKMDVESSKFKEAVIEIHGLNYSYLKVLNLFDTLDEIKKYTCSFYLDVIKKMSVAVIRKEKKIIEIVKEYILNHYYEDINLSKLADIAFVNPNYLSEIFKCQTGENFVDYFTRIRIEKAKEFLKDHKVKTYEIGALVGYEDAAYFSKVFKKVVGVSPSEYRNLI